MADTAAILPATPTVSTDVTGIGKCKLFIVVLIVVALAEAIGQTSFKLGPGQVVLLPMLWALLVAATWGIAQRYVPGYARITTGLQSYAGGLLNAGLLLFIVKLGLTVGGALPEVRQAGWALVFQEFGHAFGTLLLALPLALLLGIKREAVGATFSVGREGNLVIIGEKYGMASPEGRGVLAEYITGTVLGALFITVFAGFITSLGIFDPRSLAMGAGVGSGSLMAAAMGAIAAQQPAELVPQLTAIAAAANLITVVFGFYFTLFLSLPATSWLYNKFEPILGRFSKRKQIETAELAGAGGEMKELPFTDKAVSWMLIAVGATLGNWLSFEVAPVRSLTGMAVIVAIVAIVEVVKRLIPKMPMILVLSIVATAVGVPGLFPFSDTVIALTRELNFLAFTTPVLAIAGFSVAKDLPIFRQLGWRIVVVSLTATAGTFLGATLVAELFH
ncbi:Protein of unknown function [Collimonas sp. OK607]|uniref:DUF3100 domain-containing protein n=1 Tax=Collimonas sp. OK607 TaxID=1798194 RepID=UPI0008E84850|nr:DUF3100 domain-containing protein [Collimonas sp. OK607]SFA90317.1 Protein of unknown function [Collimonas sp. OK607]